MKTALVFGAYGTFGNIVARELASRGVPTVLVSHSKRGAADVLDAKGKPCEVVRGDVRDKESCVQLLKKFGEAVAVNSAGPYSKLGTALLEACLETGIHYCDICDDRAYFKAVRGMSARFAKKNLCAVSGCASLPAISGALALHLMKSEKNSAPPERARATLFIGNKNPKGLGAVSSAMSTLGQPIAAPQGELRGFRDGELIPIPPPFGPRKAYNFDSPEYDLFPELLGVRSVSAKAGFELRAVGWAFNLLAFLPGASHPLVSRLAHTFGKLTPPLGCSGGAIVTELFWCGGKTRVAAIAVEERGQRMAVLPCVYAAMRLCSDDCAEKIGSPTAYEFIEAETMIENLRRDGNGLWVDGVEKISNY